MKYIRDILYTEFSALTTRIPINKWRWNQMQ